MPKIIYIMGSGRSGTTILEILLANNPGIFGVGELTHIFQDGFIDDVICSCGEHVSKCAIWADVKKKCNWRQEEVKSFVSLFRSMDWHTGFPLLAMNLVPRKTLQRYHDVNQQLYQAVESVSGNSVILDSSKYAGRALALSKVFSGKVRVICLTRSPAGIVSSFQRTDAEEQMPKSLFSTVVYYLYVMSCLRVVTWRLGSRVLHVKYEEMVADPQRTLTRIEEWIGLDFSFAREMLTQNAWFNVGHIVTGNRLRKKGRIQFQTSTGLAEVRGFGSRLAWLIMDNYRKLLHF